MNRHNLELSVQLYDGDYIFPVPADVRKHDGQTALQRIVYNLPVKRQILLIIYYKYIITIFTRLSTTPD
jgi:hypothetical protein